MSKSFIGLVIFLSLLVGGLYVAPQLIIKERLAGYELAHVIIQTNNYSDEANVYAARGREVYDGRWPASDLYFDSNPPSVFPALPSLLLGTFLYFFNGDVNWAYLGSLFSFSVLIFLIFSCWGWVVFQRRLNALAVGLLGIFTAIALHLPRVFFGGGLFLDIFGKNLIPWVKTPIFKLFFSRMDDPLYTYPIYLSAIISLYLFWRRPCLGWAILAGVSAGLLFNVYFHYAFYWAIVLALLVLYSVLSQSGGQKYLLVLILTALLASSYYFVNYFEFKGWPGSQDYVLRIGIEIGRGFRLASVWFDYVWYLVFAVMTYFLYWRRPLGDDDSNAARRTAVLFWIFLAAIFLAWNVQALTGFVPHPSHWRKAISPVLFFMLLGFISRFLFVYDGYITPRLKALARGVLIVGLALLIAKKVVNASLFYYLPLQGAAGIAQHSFDSATVESWKWIGKNTRSGSRFLSNSFLTSVYLSVYTPARPFLALGANTPVANLDLENRYLAANKLLGVSSFVLRQRLEGDLGAGPNLSDDSFYLYSSYWREKSFDYAFTSSSKSIPEYKIRELIDRYGKLDLGADGIVADYFYSGPWEREISDNRPAVSGKLVYSNPKVKIYELK